MKGICVNLLIRTSFSNSSRDVAMATDFWQNLQLTIQHAGVSKRIRISQFRFTAVKGQYFATFCASLIAISPLTPEITQEVSVTFQARLQKSINLTKYLSKYGTALCRHFSIWYTHLWGL